MAFGQLLFPTRPSCEGPTDGLERAMMVANQVLHNNKMTDFAASETGVTLWNGFYIFGYDYIGQPEIKTGGGASLVVRVRDFLGGMVHVPPDWLEQDLDKIFAPVARAFSDFDDMQAADI